MSVLYLTYIPLPQQPDHSTRSSRKSSRASSTIGRGKATAPGSPTTNGLGIADEKLAPSLDRGGEDWASLRQCAEVVSVCRVRDAMGPGMEAMMAYLKYVHLLTYSSSWSD